MIKKTDLEAKCLELYLSGKTFKLNNGAEVIIPSLPIGMKAFKFIRMKDALSAPEMVQEGKSGALQFKDEEYTEEVVDSDGKKSLVKNTKRVPCMIKNPEHLDLNTEKGMQYMANMLHAILSLNYDITVDQCDGLFSMGHFDPVLTWFYTGRDDAELRASRPTVTANEPTNGTAGNVSSSSNNNMTTHSPEIVDETRKRELLR